MNVISDSQAARFVVGRSLDCDILVSSPRVSARHSEAGPTLSEVMVLLGSELALFDLT